MELDSPGSDNKAAKMVMNLRETTEAVQAKTARGEMQEETRTQMTNMHRHL